MEAGQLVQVSCAVIEGDEPMSLQWYKDGMLLVTSSEYIINNVDTQLSVLLLRKVNDQHRGTYTCLAMNPVGSSEYSSRLNVKGIHILNLIVVKYHDCIQRTCTKLHVIESNFCMINFIYDFIPLVYISLLYFSICTPIILETV